MGLPTESMGPHLTGWTQNSLDPIGDLQMWLLGFIKFREKSRHTILDSMLQYFKMIAGSLKDRNMQTSTVIPGVPEEVPGEAKYQEYLVLSTRRS